MAVRDTSGLKLGTRARSERAALRRALGAGETRLSCLLRGTTDEAPERVALSMTLGDLLGADVGTRGRVVRIASRAHVETDLRLRDLTTTQRHALAFVIEQEEETT